MLQHELWPVEELARDHVRPWAWGGILTRLGKACVTLCLVKDYGPRSLFELDQVWLVAVGSRCGRPLLTLLVVVFGSIADGGHGVFAHYVHVVYFVLGWSGTQLASLFLRTLMSTPSEHSIWTSSPYL